MSSNKNNKTVADNARREAKLLSKPAKLTLDPFGKTDVELKQPYPKELGEYAVVVIATPMTVVQFTIARPIGITDLEESSWVAHRSDQLQGMLARAKDPNQAHLDQSRTITRQQLAVQAGLLKEVDQNGKKVFYFPHRNDMDRNQLLEGARGASKKAASEIKDRIDHLTEDQKHEKQGLLTKLRNAADPLEYLDEETAKAEVKLREFYNQPKVIEKVILKHPQTYRTLCGPYFTLAQVKIPGSENLRLEDVAIRFARSVAIGMATPTKAPEKVPEKVEPAILDTKKTGSGEKQKRNSDVKTPLQLSAESAEEVEAEPDKTEKSGKNKLLDSLNPFGNKKG